MPIEPILGFALAGLIILKLEGRTTTKNVQSTTHTVRTELPRDRR